MKKTLKALQVVFLLLFFIACKKASNSNEIIVHPIHAVKSDSIPESIYRISNFISEETSGFAVDASGSLVRQTAWSPDNSAQRWHIIAVESKVYKLINVNSNKALEAAKSINTSGAQLQLNTDNGSDLQRWKFVKVHNNVYKLVNKATGLYVGVNGINIVQKTLSNDNAPEDQFVLHNLYFKNPIVEGGFADPYVVYKDGYYYAMTTSGNNIRIRKTKYMSLLNQAENRIIWTPATGTTYTSNIWAPELHYLNGRWYIYFAASGADVGQRMHVLESTSQDPSARSWIYKGKISDTSDQWAIDGTVLKHNGKNFFIWSGWESEATKLKQHLYIASMSNPWTISGERTKISSPTNVWEKYEGSANGDFVGATGVNEAPIILKKDAESTVYLVFSVSRYNSDNYSLATMNLIHGGDPLNAAHWVNKKRVFISANGVYGPGHNSFFTSGSEHWIFYHARNTANTPNGSRTARIQKISWDANGAPIFGNPVSTSSQLEIPAGE